jgi:hypothetical protein
MFVAVFFGLLTRYIFTNGSEVQKRQQQTSNEFSSLMAETGI